MKITSRKAPLVNREAVRQLLPILSPLALHAWFTKSGEFNEVTRLCLPPEIPANLACLATRGVILDGSIHKSFIELSPENPDAQPLLTVSGFSLIENLVETGRQESPIDWSKANLVWKAPTDTSPEVQPNEPEVFHLVPENTYLKHIYEPRLATVGSIVNPEGTWKPLDVGDAEERLVAFGNVILANLNAMAA